MSARMIVKHITVADEVKRLAVRLDRAKHGSRSELVQVFGEQWGWSNQKVYKELSKVGWSSGRKRRSDSGSTSVSEQVINEVGAMVRHGIRKNGKVTMQIPNIRSILLSNGRDIPVGNSQLRELIRKRHMSAQMAQQASPHQSMKSLHPNHVHQVDPSLCLLYYSPNGQQRVISDAELYKNKPEFIEKIGNLKCWRYVLTDHFSGTVIVRYYQAKGESQANLWDFLLYCWKRLEDRCFHGVPRYLVWDKGSANTSKAIKTALKALQVEPLEHKAGNPRAKGQVEGSNNLVEKLFESRLLYEPVTSVEELNEAAERWAAAFNSSAMPFYETKLNRRGMKRASVRYSLWQVIKQEQLRLLPDMELCRLLLRSEPVERKVRADMTIGFRHPVAKRSLYYDLSGMDNVYPRATVRVSPLIYGDNEVMIYVEDYRGDEVVHIVTPIAFDELSGFRDDAAVFGEGYKSKADSAVEKAAKKADQAAYPGQTEEEIKKSKQKKTAPFGGLDAHSHLGDVYLPSYLAKTGSEMDVPNPVQIEMKPLTVTAAAKWLMGTMGPRYQPEYFQQIKQAYPNGVPEIELEALAEKLGASVEGIAPSTAFTVVK